MWRHIWNVSESFGLFTYGELSTHSYSQLNVIQLSLIIYYILINLMIEHKHCIVEAKEYHSNNRVYIFTPLFLSGKMSTLGSMFLSLKSQFVRSVGTIYIYRTESV